MFLTYFYCLWLAIRWSLWPGTFHRLKKGFWITKRRKCWALNRCGKVLVTQTFVRTKRHAYNKVTLWGHWKHLPRGKNHTETIHRTLNVNAYGSLESTLQPTGKLCINDWRVTYIKATHVFEEGFANCAARRLFSDRLQFPQLLPTKKTLTVSVEPYEHLEA